MYTPIYESAKITSATPGTRIQIRHQPDCPAAADADRHCRCDVSVKIVRPGRKAVQK